MADIKGREHEVLDHGFVRVVDTMGDDDAIVQAARVSYGAGTKSVREDRGLIRYLMRNRHTSPFEMCEIKLHAKMPVFVARQWVRHRTASINEVSARYSVLPGEFYVPKPEDVQAQSKTNKQGRGELIERAEADAFVRITEESGARQYQLYTTALDDAGIARELARMNLPLNIYTEWYWKVDLHNLLHFLCLRMDPHAQKEMRLYADAIGSLVSEWVPHTFEAFNDYVLQAVTFSRQEMRIIRQFIRTYEMSGSWLRFRCDPDGELTDREWNDFLDKIHAMEARDG